MPTLEGGPYDGGELPNDPRHEFVMITRYNRHEAVGAMSVYRQVAGRMVYQQEASLAASIVDVEETSDCAKDHP